MRKTIIALALAGAMMVLTIPAAVANSENSKSTAGAGTTECRPGADNDLIGGWETIQKQDYIDEVVATIDPNRDDYEFIVNVAIPASADATWAFCDKNLDQTLCVMRTDPSPYGWTLLDNRPFRSR